jgi:hypothetical protein
MNPISLSSSFSPLEISQRHAENPSSVFNFPPLLQARFLQRAAGEWIASALQISQPEKHSCP